MLTDKKRHEVLRDIMERRRNEIIEKWVEQMKLRPEYAARPDYELAKSITEALAVKVSLPV